MYGGDAYPMPREEDVDNLIASGLMNVQSQIIQNIKLEEIPRDNVMQGPLVKVRHCHSVNPLDDVSVKCTKCHMCIYTNRSLTSEMWHYLLI